MPSNGWKNRISPYRRIQRSLQETPDRYQKESKKQLHYLELNPAHPSLQIHKLNGEWEFYVDIFYRCFFLRQGNKFTLLTIGTHKLVDRYKKK